MRRVVITGMGGLTSLGGTWPEIRSKMEAGETGTRHMQEWERLTDLNTKIGGAIDWFDHTSAYHRKTTRSMGRVAVLALRAAEKALEEAGFTDNAVLQSGRAGVACGSSFGATEPVQDFATFMTTGKAGGLNATSYIRMMSHTAPVNIGIHFGLTGRVITTSSACTSGSQGIGYAYEAVREGHADIMLAGGAEQLCPTMAVVFDTLFATSTRNDAPATASRPYDRSRDGLVVGEGAAILVLEELEHARARGATPLAEIVGFATNSDGTHITQPKAETQAIVMRTALVKGSACASQARSRSSSALTTPPSASTSTSSTANCLRVSATNRPSRNTSRRNGSSRRPASSRTGGRLRARRRSRARSRSTSSCSSNGFVR